MDRNANNLGCRLVSTCPGEPRLATLISADRFLLLSCNEGWKQHLNEKISGHSWTMGKPVEAHEETSGQWENRRERNMTEMNCAVLGCVLVKSVGIYFLVLHQFLKI